MERGSAFNIPLELDTLLSLVTVVMMMPAIFSTLSSE